MPDLRLFWLSCRLFICCRSARRVSFPWLVGCLPVWWWFENSRACLYYFFIVNDCQLVSCLTVFVGWVLGWLKRDEVFVRVVPSLRNRLVDFVLRVIYSMSFRIVFLWRVRFWLRMNAGGVLNTCKSNGIHQLAGGESGERVSNA
ncbi:hypothetical protein Tam1G_1956 [Bifidobacterium imperatoris]|uniref:Uncharacterized protein n=1 Tax=Bifidobacterium imperatoris TaxID=2020965 RepID=A0A2N5IPY5_9BIFI|nr:hypothetical protein Tam1G_1956 [Bifidobacterium imperatoris]